MSDTANLIDSIASALNKAKGYDFSPDTAEIRGVHQDSLNDATVAVQTLIEMGALPVSGPPSRTPNEKCGRCDHSFYEHAYGACDAKRGGEPVCDCPAWSDDGASAADAGPTDGGEHD